MGKAGNTGQGMSCALLDGYASSAVIGAPVALALEWIGSGDYTLHVSNSGFCNSIREVALVPIPPPPSPPPFAPPLPPPPSPPLAPGSYVTTPASGFGSGPGYGPFVAAAPTADGTVWVADGYRVVAVDGSGTVSTLAGSTNYYSAGCTDGTGAAASFWEVRGMAADGHGNLYVVDVGCNNIRVVSTATGATTTLAGNSSVGQMSHMIDGVGTAAIFFQLGGIAVDPVSGNVYLGDYNAIRRVSPAGVVTTLSVSGPSLSNLLPGLAVAASGLTLYISDSSNHCIRALDLTTYVVSTLAGQCGQYSYGYKMRG